MTSRAATLVLFAVVAGAVVAQTPAGGSNSPNQPPAVSQPSSLNQPATSNSGQNWPTQSTPAISPGVADGVSAGTEIHATLDTPLSNRTSKPGDRFTATVSDPVHANNGLDVIPSGSRIEGEVADADDGKTLAALRGKGKLSLRFRDVVLPNGQTLPLIATLISVHDTSGKNTKKANEEGRGQPGTRSKDVGIGAGAVAGSIFGGPLKGLAIGALAGGGYVLATKGKDVNLPAQTGMVIRLDQSISATMPTSIQR
ncbi:MAG: hypothetical protein LAO78_23870 [Acidobacteriia bacterium]|nr:hypothetical protein [Terriglobia bacterium]